MLVEGKEPSPFFFNGGNRVGEMSQWVRVDAEQVSGSCLKYSFNFNSEWHGERQENHKRFAGCQPSSS